MSLVALCVYGGLLGLSLAMDKHYRQIFAGVPTRSSKVVLKSIGWILLVAALVLSVSGAVWSFGLLAWFGWLLAAGLCLVLCLATVPRVALLVPVLGVVFMATLA